MPEVIAIIPARYGSTRFPGKPLALISGKTLLQRTYEQALLSTKIDRVVIATDDERILAHCQEIGAETCMTSSDCPTGTDRVIEACLSLKLHDQSIILNLQGDTPLIEPHVIDGVIEALESPLEVMATAATPLLNEDELHSPHVVKCVVGLDGHALYFSRAPLKGSYHHIGIYGFRWEFLKHMASFPETPLQQIENLEQLKVLERGFQIKVALVKSRSLGVDRPEDVKTVEDLLCQ